MADIRTIFTRVALLSLAMLVGVAMTNFAVAQQVMPTPGDGDETGFESIFDGETLDGWEGDPTYWRVEDGALVGEITPETVLEQNSFIIWRGGVTRDFELKLEFRISEGGNSGVNYRSERDRRHAVRPPRLSGRHRRRQPLHRPVLRGEGPHIPRPPRRRRPHRRRRQGPHHRLRGRRRRAGRADPSRRLERHAPHRPRQRDDAPGQRPRHVRRDRRRPGAPQARRPARACRSTSARR